MNLERFPFDPIYQFNNGEELRGILREQNVDLIHARFGVTGAEILDVKQKLGIPMLTSFHGFDVPTNTRTIKKYNGRLDRLFEEGDAFTVTSENMKQILVESGCPQNKIFVHYSGIDVEKFVFEERKLPEDGMITLLSVGRLVEKKGMKYLIEAFHRVYEQYPYIRLRIAGEGILRNELEAQVKLLELEDVVKFLGEASHEDVAREIQQAHVFALASTTTSYGDQEGIPNVLKEALASGLPVVSTKHAGIPELVHDRKSGFLVPERDTAAMAECLLQIIQNPSEWKEIGERGSRTVKHSFNTKKQTEELEYIYNFVLTDYNNRGRE
jgi:colanic acid/amylovoran biosynthesis glycosyltransferase